MNPHFDEFAMQPKHVVEKMAGIFEAVRSSEELRDQIFALAGDCGDRGSPDEASEWKAKGAVLKTLAADFHADSGKDLVAALTAHYFHSESKDFKSFDFKQWSADRSEAWAVMKNDYETNPRKFDYLQTDRRVIAATLSEDTEISDGRKS